MSTLFDLSDTPLLPALPTASSPVDVRPVSAFADERILLSVVEAAKRLGIGRSLMYELLGSGQVRSIHVGRLRKIPVAALSEFVAEQPLV